jgi:RNA polymerase sigma-70 factor (ECF subfamily)
MALCRNLRAGKLKGDVCPWLMTVTVNLAVTHARKARVRDAAAERAVHQGNVEAADSGEDASFLLAKALVKLPERQREAVSLVVLGGLSYKEAAGRLGSEESTVRKQVSDARVKLRFLVAEDRKGDSS